MHRLQTLIIALVLLTANMAVAEETYESTRVKATEIRDSNESNAKAKTELEATLLELSGFWLGSTWGLGAPQSSTPQVGKINCGTFVGTLLVHAGFDVNHKKLQRQPSELIIKTFAGKKDIKRFRNKPVKDLLEGVKSMGDGFYILGLDYHVGFIYVEGESVRFIHSNFFTDTVVDEPAEFSEAILTSKYRVVGKLLTPKTLRRWRKQTRIKVVGKW